MFTAFRRSLVVFLALTAGWARVARTQAGNDPRAPMPERPTVATHAWTVAPGYVELETGLEWDQNPDDSHALSTPTLLKIGLARGIQLSIQSSLTRPPGTSVGLGDLFAGTKIRLADHLPVLGAFALLPGLKLPLADHAHGPGTTDGSILLISSHTLGPVSLDVNAGYTRRSGDGSAAPRNATVWTVSTGFPLKGILGGTIEVFGFPGTSGPAGGDGTVALLAGPTFSLRPRWTADLGGILQLHGPQPNALYTGVVYNLGAL
jgi:hypothetical protein